jgi:hypothetical protein
VPAVRRHGRPAELERQKGEQEDDEDSTHGQESSGYRVGRGAAKSSAPWGFHHLDSRMCSAAWRCELWQPSDATTGDLASGGRPRTWIAAP